GPKTAANIVTFFSQEQTKSLLASLKSRGIGRKDTGISIPVVEGFRLPPMNSEFSDKEFVITGTLPNLSRAEASEIIQRLGGRTADNVSKKTSALIVGDKPGSKLEKARRMEIKIILAEEFEEVVKKCLLDKHPFACFPVDLIP
ncbi:hypothetical protein HY793_00345, partial [Candidatus Desantisbacteria bacterium]|nr:hypothetical protein [Candidatus Desantisbacteria bacterium]